MKIRKNNLVLKKVLGRQPGEPERTYTFEYLGESSYAGSDGLGSTFKVKRGELCTVSERVAIALLMRYGQDFRRVD